MIIKKQSPESWIIKTQKSKITFNSSVLLDEFKIPGSGEYEVKGIQAEISSGIYTFYIEDLILIYLGKNKKDFTAEEIKKIAKSDILMLPVSGNDTMDTKTALKIISEAEPSIVIPIHYTNIDELVKSEAIKVEELEELKITKNDINKEERKVIVLK